MTDATAPRSPLELLELLPKKCDCGGVPHDGRDHFDSCPVIVIPALRASIEAERSPCIWTDDTAYYHAACGYTWVHDEKIESGFCIGCGHPISIQNLPPAPPSGEKGEGTLRSPFNREYDKEPPSPPPIQG